MSLAALGGLKAAETLSRRKKYTSNLYALCTDILGYDKLSPTFHGPMLRAWDRIDLARFKTGPGGKIVDTLDLWPRDHIKTWCMRARIIRYYLLDPTITVTGWHAVEEMAQDSGVAIGKTLQQNKELRRLFPQGVLPSPMAKKFVTATGFSLRSNRIGDAPSFRAWGAGSEATGGHSRIGWLDDINAYNDLVDSQFPKKKQWYQATVRNVVRSDGWVDAIGTRWDREDTWAFLMSLPGWVTTTRAALETDGKPDYAGEPVYLTRAQIEKKRAELGEVMFALQMMNDPSPQGQKPWTSECEQYCTREEAKGPGLVVVLSDPAPAKVGSDQPGEARDRGTEKNEWAICTVKFRRFKDLDQMILLSIQSSKEWEPSAGFKKMVQMGRSDNARYWALEKVGMATAFYTRDVRDAIKAEGAKMSEVELESTYRGKNARFARLADRAKVGELLICETAKGEALDKFLDQSRRWRPLDSGSKNGLRLDDCADVVSYATDPAWASYVPKSWVVPEEWSPYRKPPEDDYEHGARHVRW